MLLYLCWQNLYLALLYDTREHQMITETVLHIKFVCQALLLEHIKYESFISGRMNYEP